jgi:hypothetical protein
MTDIDYDAIEARAAAATEGPWANLGHDIGQVVYDSQGPCELVGPVMLGRAIGEAHPTDAEFIAHARTDIPALLTALRERDATIARVRDVAEELIQSFDRVESSRALYDAPTHRWVDLLRAALDPQEGQ